MYLQVSKEIQCELDLGATMLTPASHRLSWLPALLEWEELGFGYTWTSRLIEMQQLGKHTHTNTHTGDLEVLAHDSCERHIWSAQLSHVTVASTATATCSYTLSTHMYKHTVGDRYIVTRTKYKFCLHTGVYIFIERQSYKYEYIHSIVHGIFLTWRWVMSTHCRDAVV